MGVRGRQTVTHDLAAVSRWAERLERDPTPEAMDEVSRGLAELRERSRGDGTWAEIRASAPMARLRRVAHACPYTRRGYEKPRGYPGDAVLLDFIYGSAPIPDDTAPLGEAILGWMSTHSSGFRSVRWRRDHFAERLDELAAEGTGGRVASVACGHFREGTRSEAVVGGRFDEVLAIDQDPRSLGVVANDQPAVTPTRTSVRDLIAGRASLDGFRFVYSAGLFDYLAESYAVRLVNRLFDALEPGGTLVVANFVRMWEAGWMEALMDWHLIYRTPEEVAGFARGIDPAHSEMRTYLDPPGNVVYLEVRKG